jgi:hypothetical protein
MTASPTERDKILAGFSATIAGLSTLNSFSPE